MDSVKFKEVFFDVYCPTCKYKDDPDDGFKEPCNECLTIPARENSHKPEKWEGKDD